jgi:hypothetical protein
MLVIISLTSLGFGAPAVAASGPPDCMAMMQAGHGSSGDKMRDSGKSCPFADLCAVANYFVDPAPPSHFAPHDPVELGRVAFDDELGDGVKPTPPSRPPRS